MVSHYVPFNNLLLVSFVYEFTYPFAEKNIFGHNAKRVAEVWLDEYKRLFYSGLPGAKVQNIFSYKVKKHDDISLEFETFNLFTSCTWLEDLYCVSGISCMLLRR